MNQNINLYLPEFRKQPAWLDGKQMVQYFGVVVLVLALMSIWQVTRQQEKQSTLQQLETESRQLAGTVASLEAQVAGTNEEAMLEMELELLQRELSDKQVLLDFLEGRELGNATGFSEYLADLSRYHTAGLSLSGISLRRGGNEVELTGQVLEAELVPLYLQSLRQGQMYVGKNFQTLTISDELQAGSNTANGEAQPDTFWEFRVSTATARPH